MHYHGLLDQFQMTNKGQMENLFRNINLEISRLYFCLERNNQRIYELHSDWSIHPSEKILELTDLKRKILL